LSQILDLEKFRQSTSTVASAVNLVHSSVHLCVQHYGRNAARRAGSSVTAETCDYGVKVLPLVYQVVHYASNDFILCEDDKVIFMYCVKNYPFK